MDYDYKNNLRCALYLRLSDEDNDKASIYDKSESIKNQEKILRDYAMINNFDIVGIYNDEDWSGSDWSRPEFNKMIRECERGNIDIVLCKTQARFARDMELIEKYLYNKFIEWNIRFVTVVDRIDNYRKETKKTSQILGLTDEWYLEDTSLNIRQTFRTKRINGEFTGAFTPYGYVKDSKNKNHLVIDNNVCSVIKKIFNDYNNGSSIFKIINDLDKEQILSPFEYKLVNGSKLKIPFINSYLEHNYIDKAGDFVIRVSCVNNDNRLYSNIFTLNILTNDILFSNDLDISLRNVDSDTFIYYSVNDLSDLNISCVNSGYIFDGDNHYNFDFDNDNPGFNDANSGFNDANFDFGNVLDRGFILLNIGESIPKNTTCILSYTKSFDRGNEIYYELDAVLSNNKCHNIYRYKVFPLNGDSNLDFNVNIRKRYKWSFSTIKKILMDEVYIGNLVQSKTTTVSYKNHTRIYNGINDRIRVSNTHEAIIGVDLWNSVQKRLKQSKKTCCSNDYDIFSNKVFCGDCNKVFYKCGKKNKNGFSYLCCSDKRYKWSNCDNNKYINWEVLYNFVLDKINNLFKDNYNLEKLISLYNLYIDNCHFKDEISVLHKEEYNVNVQIKRKKAYFKELYEDRKNGFIDSDEYFELRRMYKEECTDLNRKLENIRSKLDMINNYNFDKKYDFFDKYRYVNELNFMIVNEFIDKIIIDKYDSSLNQRKIHIIWNFDF